jgi:hypothetical protein
MKQLCRYTLFTALLLLLTSSAACSCEDFFGSDGTPGEIISATNPALVLYNISGNIKGVGEPIGNAPEMLLPETDLSLLSYRAVANRPSFIKGHPELRNNGILLTPETHRSMADTVRRQPPITSSTESYTFAAISADGFLISINATMQAEGNRCYVFVETGEEGVHDWNAIADFFDTTVWSKNVSLFGEPVITAPTASKGSDKIVILYYKMRYRRGGKEETRILGFFWSEDLYSDNNRSNGMNIFYMNLSHLNIVDPKYDPRIEMDRTLFHEFQHMINYSRRVLELGVPEMDLWMNEGLAESAEHFGTDFPGLSRIWWMNNDLFGRLSNGESLVVWPRDADDTNYGLVYTFMQYLRLQSSGGWNFMTELIKHEYGTYRALEEIMKGSSGSPDLTTFDEMVRNYHLARFLNNPSGLYGFGGSPGFTFTPRAPSVNVASLKLGPGGAIFIPTTSTDLDDYKAANTSSVPSGAGVNIRFHPHDP